MSSLVPPEVSSDEKIRVKVEPIDSSSLLSSPRPQDKNKNRGQLLAAIEISSDEEDNDPTPKGKYKVPSTPSRSNKYVFIKMDNVPLY